MSILPMLRKIPDRVRALSACLALFILLAAPSLSPAAREQIVSEVEVSGNSRLSREAILARIETQAGKPFSQNALNGDLARLNEWGPFSSLEFRVDDAGEGAVKVLILVSERPLINKVEFDGSREFDDDDLAKKIASAPGQVLDEAKLKADAEKIVAEYRKEGYLNATVSPVVKPVPGTGEVRVRFDIAEGKEVRIREIKFAGLSRIDPSVLRGDMKTKAKSFPFRSGILDVGEFALDQERIVYYCRQEGFLDAKLLGVEYEYTPDGKWLDLVIRLEEGPLYRAGQIQVLGAVRFPEAALREMIQMKENDVFSPVQTATDRRSLADFYQSRGYMDVEIRPLQVYNQATEKMDLTYSIAEGEISYINRIEIEGNDITKDVVIRREMGVIPGDIFDGVRVRRSWERLNNLGYFESVAIDQVPAVEPGKKDLVVRVAEKKTGQFMFGFGYSSVDDFIGYAEIGNSNVDILNPANGFLGGGQKLRLRGELGTEVARYELSFTEPWLFGYPLSGGFDLYRRDRSWSYYNETRKGFDLRLRRHIFGVVQGGLTYRLEQVGIHNVDQDAFIEIKDEEGESWVSSITASLTGDTRDSFLVPTRGMRNNLSCELAGGPFGGDQDFVKTSYDFSVYQELFWEKWVLAFKFRAGTISTYGDTEVMPVYDRFYLGGGNTIRGFRYREVGPYYQDEDGDYQPIGGNSMLMGTVEFTFPIIGGEIGSVRGALFLDAGNLWVDSTWEDNGIGYPETASSRIFTRDWFDTINSSAGFGLRLYLPIGPIKLDYGYPLRTGPDGWNDSGGRFHFNIGYEF